MSDDESAGEPHGRATDARPGDDVSSHTAKTERAGDFFAGLVVFLIALYALSESVRMPYYGDSGLLGSPGLTPGLISAVLLLLSGLLMYRSREFASAHIGLTFGDETRRGFGTFALIFAYVAAIPFAGYVPATFVMLFIFQVVYAKTRDVRFLVVWALGLSAILTVVLYYVFAEIFLIPLPRGMFGV